MKMENDENIDKIGTPAAEEMLKKIQKLEEEHARLKEEISKLTISHEESDPQRSNSVSPGRPGRRINRGVSESGHGAGSETFQMGPSSYPQSSPSSSRSNRTIFLKGGAAALGGGGVSGSSAVNLTEDYCVNILQSMGQAVHAFEPDGRIVYWNQMAQNLYGYTPAEAIGNTAPDIIIGPKYAELATLIITRGLKGESWSGEFPVRNKYWERFTVITTVSPCRDENGRIFGATCVSTDARPFQELRQQSSVSAPWRISPAKFGLDSQQPLQTAIISKISNLASKVKSKMKTGENTMDHDGRNDNSRYSDFAPLDHRQDASFRKPTTDSSGGSESRPGIHKVLSLKAETWMGKKGISWPWKGNGNEGDDSYIRTGPFGWPWVHNDQKQESAPQTGSSASMKLESQLYESASASNTNEAPGSWSSSNGASSSGSTNGSSVNIIEIDLNSFDVDISWDDLMIGEQIGQGSCGTVYHALWYGSDVAVKVFTKQEFPDDVILSFRKEVSIMKRLRHPSILLFMGAVISPQHLCIVTEFLPRGSLFRLLQRNTTKLDWRRRVHMAMDIAQGMNYLHRCQPPIVHRDLKSSNLLVDKNWTVKVSDFGLSHIKLETYLTTKTGKGTPRWMAPETLRNEQADEKLDVYSYGVVLWEITTGKIPWENLNSMQVIGAVGFMNQRLEIPKDVDPQWASLIESCWSSEPQSRPTFQEILTKLKDLQKKFAVQFQVPRRDDNYKKGS